MNKLTRRLGTLALMGAAAMMLVGCGSKVGREGPVETAGELALPLVTQSASGVTYRLRDATFAIHPQCYYYDMPAVGGTASGGTGMGGGCGDTILLNSEDEPDAQNLTVSLQEGQYYIELLPGWHFEKDGPMGPQVIQATLLSGETQWIWVSRQITTFAEYQFGVGDRQMWLNGQLNIGVRIYEDPSEVYAGTAGSGGFGTAGSVGMGWGGGVPVPAGTGGTGAGQ